MNGLKALASAAFAALVAVSCVDYVASAATGHAFILGRITSTGARVPGGPEGRLTADADPATARSDRGTVSNRGAGVLRRQHRRVPPADPLVFTRNITTPVGLFRLIASVPVGTYLVSYSVYVESQPMSPLGSLDCFVQAQDADVRRYVAESYVETSSPRAAASGSGLVTKSAHNAEISLVCKSPDAAVRFVSYSGEPASQPVQLVLTRVDAARESGPGYAPSVQTTR
jgi:hypothetical protein